MWVNLIFKISIVLTAISTMAMAYIAYKALDVWKNQLKGQHIFNQAINLADKSELFKNSYMNCRLPLSFQIGLKLDHPDFESKFTGLGKNNRKTLLSILSEIGHEITMIEFIQGKNNFLATEIKELYRMDDELYFAYQFYPTIRVKRELQEFEKKELLRIEPYLFCSTMEDDDVVAIELSETINKIKIEAKNLYNIATSEL